MNVALSTDDPLLFHMSDDALLEEVSCEYVPILLALFAR